MAHTKTPSTTNTGLDCAPAWSHTGHCAFQHVQQDMLLFILVCLLPCRPLYSSPDSLLLLYYSKRTNNVQNPQCHGQTAQLRYVDCLRRYNVLKTCYLEKRGTKLSLTDIIHQCAHIYSHNHSLVYGCEQSNETTFHFLIAMPHSYASVKKAKIFPC